MATAKHLIDFYDVPKERLHIVTLDETLIVGSRKIAEVPYACNPTESGDSSTNVFRDAP